MKKIKKLFPMMITLVFITLILVITSTAASAKTYSGFCGNGDVPNVKWSLDTDTGVLNISGTGEMKKADIEPKMPWLNYKEYIKEVVIEQGIINVGKMAFKDCRALTSVIIPDSVTSIDEQAFNGCDSLTTVDFLDGVTDIGRYAFAYCDSFTNIDIPDGVKIIGFAAFYGCTSLKTFTVSDSVTSIGSMMLGNCSSLEHITLPFLGNSKNENGVLGYIFAKNDGSNPGISVEQGSSYYMFPKSLRSVTVTGGEIRDYAFQNCKMLTSITLPDGITSIGNFAFSGCASLTTVAIPDSVKNIGNNAFAYCTLLTGITIPDGVVSIGEWAFGECPSLKSIIIPDSVTNIGDDTFFFSESFTIYCYKDSYAHKYAVQRMIPYSLIGILDGGLMWYIDNLGILTIFGNGEMSNFTSSSPAPWYEFRNSVKSVIIKNGVTNIGDLAFLYCLSLESVAITDSVTSIGKNAFLYCTSLKTVTIPESVKSIDDQAFDVRSEDLVIRCLFDSYADKYAIAHNIPVEYTNKVVSLSMKTLPSIVVYPMGATLDLDGLVLDVTYDVGVTGSITGGYTVGEYDFSTAGKKDIAVSIDGHSAEFTVTVLSMPIREMTAVDVKNTHWYYKSVKYCYERSYINGMSETKFSPNSDITREQFVLILANIAGVDTDEFKNAASGFEDVKTGQWYSGAVTWAVREGYVSGMSPTKFGRGQSIQRAALARMLYNYASKNGINVEGRADLSSFGDAKEFDKAGNAWMKEPVQWAVYNGIISGMTVDGKNCVNPKGTATRAQAARMLMQFDGLIK